jgi:hypothetical protein
MMVNSSPLPYNKKEIDSMSSGMMGRVSFSVIKWPQETNMRKLNPISRLHRLAMVLLGVVIVLDLCVSIYHLTHQGLGSGITELILASLLLTAIYFFFVFHTQHIGDSVLVSNRYRKAGLAIIALATSVVLFLGIYHLTHEGLRSGVIELSMTTLLAISGYLISWHQ